MRHQGYVLTLKSVAGCLTLALVGMTGPQAISLTSAQTPAPAKAPAAVQGDDPFRGCKLEEFDINADCDRTVPSTQSAKSVQEKKQLVDLTGTWVSLVIEDWRWRMLTPPKGDIASLPLNDAGKKTSEQWDPSAKDACKAFGAAGLMRNPMRVRFSWADDNTLKLETDHGQQTRLYHFDRAALKGGEHTMQGESLAEWDSAGVKVTTTNMTAGYLRKNGVPYSENAVLTEYWNRYSAFDDEYLTVISVVTDPKYLTREMIVSTDFKRLKDDSSWHPMPCDGSADNTSKTITAGK